MQRKAKKDKGDQMNEDKMQRMKELVECLIKAAYVYEQEDREIMSNFEYDALYDELKKLEEETGTILAGSVTQKVGYEIAAYLTLPFIGIGFCFSFVKYQGMTFREVSCEIIKWAILRPRRRVYKTENIYDYIKK